MSDLPTVSVIVPMYQERDHIGPCIDGLRSQTYPGDKLEFVIVDGGSTDGSRQIVLDASDRDARVRLVDNERRVAAAAANEGIKAAKGEVLCFLSAHGVPSPTYVEASVRVLLETGAAGVGGRYEHVGTDATSSAIGLAMASPYGMASPHRVAGSRREVDTISHPTFWASVYDTAGLYDETLRSNEDYELNTRVRRLVGPLVFDPSITSVYRPRRTLRALAKQFHAYGQGKAQVLRRDRSVLRPRHAVPPAAVAAAPMLLLHPGGRRALAVLGAGYAVVLAAAAAEAQPWRRGAKTSVFLAALPTMHAAWGAGLLRGIVRPPGG